MATQPEIEEPFVIEEGEEGTELESDGIGMLDAIGAPNLVPLLEKGDVTKIGSEALAEYNIDLGTCEEFHKRYDAWMDMAMQVTKEKTFPWPNASNVIYPHLTTSAIQFQARAYPAIINGNAVVKGRVLGNDSGVKKEGVETQEWETPPGAKRERANRVAAHMSWQFLNDVPGWEEDTDRLLLQLPIVGCVFRKTWRDTLRDQNNSETVVAKDLVVNYHTASFEKAPRFTHIQRYYPHEIEAYIRSGEWEKVAYDGEDGSDPHSIVTILEQHRLIDMDDDGLPEPYVVTITEDGEVARIVACYDADGIYVSTPSGKQMRLSEAVNTEQISEDMRIIRIERKEYFTKYGFIPAPDGSFYDIGFGFLIENLSKAYNSTMNQLIDAGTLSNMQGGFLAGGTKIRGGNMRFTPGEWKRVEGVTAGPLRDNILPLQLPGPSPVLFQMLGLLNDAIQSVTSVSDILSGNQDTQTAPTTALALIEQGQKVFTAIYQRIHRALGVEIKNMRRLNRDYLDEDQYFELNDEQANVGRADYQDRDLDVMPISDPRAINDRVKIAKAEMLSAHSGDPMINQLEIRKRKFEAVGIDNIESLFEVPEPGPDPKTVLDGAKMQNERERTMAEIRAKDAETAVKLIEAAKTAYELGMVLDDASMLDFATEMLADATRLAGGIHEEVTGNGNMQPEGLPAMEGEPGNEGLPPIPEGLGIDGIPGMGGEIGPVGADGPPAIPSGDLGRPSEPVM